MPQTQQYIGRLINLVQYLLHRRSYGIGQQSRGVTHRNWRCVYDLAHIISLSVGHYPRGPAPLAIAGKDKGQARSRPPSFQGPRADKTTEHNLPRDGRVPWDLPALLKVGSQLYLRTCLAAYQWKGKPSSNEKLVQYKMLSPGSTEFPAYSFDSGEYIMTKRKIWYIPTASHTTRVFTSEAYQQMLSEFAVTVNDTDEGLTTEQVAERIADYDGLITGWGSAPPLTAEVFEATDRLQIIAHSAGSVKWLLSPQIVEQYLIPRDIITFSAAPAIADNVAEAAVGMLIMTCRRWVDRINYTAQTDGWRHPDIDVNGQFLLGSTVGVIGASLVGRRVIELLQPWNLTILLYDPYVSDQEAEQLGAEKVGLNELFRRSDHVTVHAPATPETEKMIGSEQLALLRQRATVVNTARGSVIDEAALIAEAQNGRINVCLDVTDPEPPAADSPLRKLDNVYLTPHVAGAGYYGYHNIGQMTLQALRDCFAGRPVQGAVDYTHFSQLA